MGYNIGIFVSNNSDQRGSRMAKLIQAVIPTARCTTINLRMSLSKDYWIPKPKTKAAYMKGPRGDEVVPAYLERLAAGAKYDAFVSIDFAMTQYLLPPEDAKTLSNADKVSGMLMDLHGKPLLFHFDPLHTYARHQDPEYHAKYVLMSSFKLKKLVAAMQGTAPPEKPMMFMLPSTHNELRACEKIAAMSSLIAWDIETSGKYISCIGFACETKGPVTPVFVIPFFVNTEEAEGQYWATSIDYQVASDTVGRVLANDVPKVTHNGSFDLTYIYRYGWTVNNHIFDTMLMIHAMWPSMPRALYIGCSIFLQGYRYWKDDAKAVDEMGKVKYHAPKTIEATHRYLHYNGLDCLNTLELCIALLRIWTGEHDVRFPDIRKPEYAFKSYTRKLLLEFGPCLYMSLSGIRASGDRQIALYERLTDQGREATHNLRTLVNDPAFNPNSPQQTAELIYDVLNLKPIAKKGRTTDKRFLQRFADMHCIYQSVIKAVWDAKEPLNNASKYGEMPLFADQWFMYQLKAAVTTTSRLASSQSNMRYGTNVQNMPKSMRIFCHADKGQLLVASDYSQSDSYFVAFESGDEAMIETVTDDRDTHSVHVEFFFGRKYEDVVAGDKAKEAWVVHPVTGLRQIIKKVSHGTNYDMGGATMLLNVRKDAAVMMVEALLQSANAKALLRFCEMDTDRPVAFYQGQASLWGDAQLARACDFAQALYYKRYPRLKQWKTQAVGQATMDGGVIEMFGGSSTVMLCKPDRNERFVPAAYGQGGTAGNINNAMIRLYFLAEHMWRDGFRMLLQVHDELICSVPQNKPDLIQKKVDIMEAPCTIKGRTFTVPVAAEITYSWDPKNTVDWAGQDMATLQTEVLAVENKTRKGLGMAPIERLP